MHWSGNQLGMSRVWFVLHPTPAAIGGPARIPIRNAHFCSIVATCAQNRSDIDGVVAADHACNLTKHVIVTQGNEVNPVHHAARIQLLATREGRTVIVGSFASGGLRPTGFATRCFVFTVFRDEGVAAPHLSSSCTQKTHHQCQNVRPLGATPAAQVSGKIFLYQPGKYA